MEHRRLQACVFAGSQDGVNPAFRHQAAALGRALAARQMDVVYGGAGVGLMRVVADAALEAGSRVTGVFPRCLIPIEARHDGLSELRIVTSLMERKQEMAELSDLFIAVPGGLGTLDELCEMVNASQIGDSTKPCGILNVDGYYDALLAWLDHGVDQGLVRAEHRALLMADRDIESLLDRLVAAIAATPAGASR